MNSDQITGAVRAIVPAIVAWIAASLHYTGDTGFVTSLLIAVIVAIVSTVWSYYSNTTGKTIR
jgi:hypothetical protein